MVENNIHLRDESSGLGRGSFGFQKIFSAWASVNTHVGYWTSQVVPPNAPALSSSASVGLRVAR